MTSSTPDPPAPKRGEPDRTRDPRELVPAIEARRNLKARNADDLHVATPTIGPADPRYAYLTESHD